MVNYNLRYLHFNNKKVKYSSEVIVLAELYNSWNNFFNSLSNIKKAVEPFALRSGLSADEALALIIVNDFPETVINLQENFTKMLCEKGLLEYNENGLKLNPKGKIIAKSVKDALKKF